MAIVKDIKELPKDEVKLKKYTLIILLVCLLTSIGLTILYLLRITKANKDDISAPSIIVSTPHFLGYMALTVVSSLGLFGAYFQKKQFLVWFSIGGLALVIGECVCLIYGYFIQDVKEKKPSILMTILTIFVIILFAISAVFAFLLKKFIPDSVPATQVEAVVKK